MKGVHLELPEDLLSKLDEVRGRVPRNRWIRDLIETDLGGTRPRLSDPAGVVRPTRNGTPTVPPEPPKPTEPPPPPKPVQTKKRGCAHENTRYRFGVRICYDCGERL